MRLATVIGFLCVVTAFTPASAAQESLADGAEFSQYKGRITGLSFQNVPIRRALFQLANFYGFNLIASDSIEGEITIDLKEVPWDQALALVLRMKRLSGRLEGNVLYVAPTQEIAEQDFLDVQAAAQAEALAPLLTEFLQINYANAGDIMQLLTGVGAKGGRLTAPAQGGVASRINQGLLSPRGSASVDPRTNIIIVRDTAEKLAEVRQMLSTLDIAVRQVLIEARIVNVETNFGRELGVRWGLGGSAGKTRFGGSQATTADLLSSDFAAADALRGLAGDRHRAFWHAAGVITAQGYGVSHSRAGSLAHADRPIADLFDDAASGDSDFGLGVMLPLASESQNVAGDYAATGFTLRRHPLALLREHLDCFGANSSAQLGKLGNDQATKVAGLVTCRQRPMTASGVTFLTLEDEAGHMNVVVWPALGERLRPILRQAMLIGVVGRVQESEGVIHVIADNLVDLTSWLGELSLSSRDFT
ncbi:MAG TPA: hypothetical protein DIT42_08540 [Gammaproteobacteria bacterium]|nr:hypothetical protein [Gammaproteobacteria bacterium]